MRYLFGIMLGSKLHSTLLAIALVSILAVPVKSYQFDMTYTKLDESIGKYSNYEGNYLLVDAMATWCVPCELSMVHLEEVYKTAGDQVPLLSISLDPSFDTLETLKDYKERFDAKWEFGLDHDEEFKKLFNVTGFPTLFFFDPDGLVLKVWKGLVSSETILKELDKYMELSGKLGRSINVDDFLNDLYNSHRFFLFLSFMWGLTIFLVVRMIRMRNLSKNRPSQESIQN